MNNLLSKSRRDIAGRATGVALLAALASCVSGNKEIASLPEIMYADPTIFVENGKFYLAGTRNSQPTGFVLLESDDLATWRPANDTDSMILMPGADTYGTKGFWAPQILRNDDGTYTFVYTANEQTAVAGAPELGSRFVQAVVEPIDSTEKNIDPFIFRDDDGKEYLYHVRFDHGNYLWVAEFDSSTGKLNPETLQRCFTNTQAWEKTPDYPADPIMEGPTVIKLGGTYYLFYSANHFMSRDYAVGYATAPTPMGPWTKYENNPIIHRSLVGENGSGHGDIFADNNGHLRYVYHVHNSDSVVAPRRTRIIDLQLTSTGDKDVPYTVAVDPSSIIKPVIKL